MKKKYTEEEFLDIANQNKLEGYYKNIPVYSNPYVPPDTIYFLNDNFTIEHPKRKDGQPDMRYGINKLEAVFKEPFK